MGIIIESTRIKTKSGSTNICRHLLDKHEENESITLLQGDRRTMQEAFDSARNRTRPSKYALRHWVVAPQEDMTDQQAMQTLEALADEFGFNPADASVVKHEKERFENEGSRFHYHICVPEVLENNRVLSDKKNYQRHEKLSRILEQRFGFSHIVGRHNKAVSFAVADLNPELSAVAEKLAQEPLPKTAYTKNSFQEAKRKDIDIKKLTRLARTECEGIHDFSQISANLDGLGLAIIGGKHKRPDGRQTPVISTQDGFVLGSVASILKMRATEITDFLDQQEAVSRHQIDMQNDQHMALDLGAGGGSNVVIGDLDSVNRLDMQDNLKPVKSWEQTIDDEQKKLKTIFEAPHPDLIEETPLTIKERIQKHIKNNVSELQDMKKEYSELNDEIKELKAKASMFNNNKSHAKSLEDKNAHELSEQIKAIAVFIAKSIGSIFGYCEAPGNFDLMTPEARNKLALEYKENQLAQHIASNQKKREEGIYSVALKVATKQTESINEWQERPEARDARRMFNRLENLKNLDVDNDGLDHQAMHELHEAQQIRDIKKALDAVTGSQKRETEAYKQEMSGQKQEIKEEIQHVKAVHSKSKGFDMI